VTQPVQQRLTVSTKECGATFSPCRKYRYALWREWDSSKPAVVFCGLNPSTADEAVDDPTIRRELGYARSWGFGRLVKVNAYGYRSTDPRALWKVEDPRGPDNFLAIKAHCFEAMKRAGGMQFVAAWGNNIRDRDALELRSMLRFEGVPIHALRLTKRGQPQHPLYLPKDMLPFVWAWPAPGGGV
jgi:hypothetical protein